MTSRISRVTKHYTAPVLRRADELARATAVAKTISGKITKDGTN